LFVRIEKRRFAPAVMQPHRKMDRERGFSDTPFGICEREHHEPTVAQSKQADKHVFWLASRLPF